MACKRGSGNRSSSSLICSSKRGQVTIFIIVGIILVFTFAAILYFTQLSTKSKLSAEGEPVLAEVPQTFMPLNVYTENCLSQIGKRGLLILGQQGGYIHPELLGEYSANNPTESPGVNLEPAKIPYWHYAPNPNTASEIAFSSLQPKLRYADDPELSVEAQLGRYVNERLSACVGSYNPFTEQGFTIAINSVPETEVKVGENSVNFLLAMEVDAAKGEATHTFEQFYVKIPLRFKHYYEVAEEVTQTEVNYSFLERQALDLISTYSAVDSDKLPPTEAVTFDLIPTAYWTEADVKEKVKGMLVSHVPLLRYLGATNFYRYDYLPSEEAVLDLRDLYQKNYDNMIIPLEKGNDVEVNFDYFGWELYFDVNDKGGRIEPSSYGVSFSRLQFNTNHYYTTYDVSYPVLITLRDPTAFGGEGYTFVFALEVNIRNNRPVQAGQVLPPPIAAVGKSMACDERKWNTEPIRTVVVDSSNLNPLEAVQVGFSIPESADCIIGATDAHGQLESKYPAVYGGVGSFIKEDYLTSFYPIDTYNFKKQSGIMGYAVAGLSPAERVIELHPLKLINVTIKKKNIEKCINGRCYTQGLFSTNQQPLYSYQPQMLSSVHSWVFMNTPLALEESETGTLILKRVADLNPGVFSDEFTASVAVQGNSNTEVELVPGVYEVQGLLTSEKEVIIPEEERCTGGFMESVACFDTSGCCFTFDRTVLDKMLTGQLQWDTQRMYVTITPEQLYTADQLTFYIPSVNLGGVPQEEHLRVLEDLQVIGQLGNFSQQLRANLEPRFG